MSDATVEFALLCAMFDSVVRTKKAALKRKHVRTFLEQVYTDREYFSALRLMLPSLDKDRATYGVKETVLGKYLADALGLAKESKDAQKLLNWRKGGTRVGSNAGNFAFIAAEVLHSRQRVTSKGLKIKDINDLLDRLAAAEKREEKVAVLADMINNTNAQEMRWIIVIILKDLKLGISENTIFSEFHPDAQDLFNVTCALKLVCEKLRNRGERYNRQDIEVGRAVRPQLAARVASVEEAWKKFRGKRVTAECKFDGDRIQVHKNGSELHFYSRNFIDHQQFKDGMADVLISNVIPEKCILDGEMLVWDRASNRFAGFGSNREAAKAAKDGLETNQQLCYVAFDVLYLGNGSVIHLPLYKRQELLYSAIRPVKGRLELLLPNAGNDTQRSSGEPKWSITANSADEIERFFQDTVENREEGIILKDLDSKWEPSDRNGKWLKLKPDYVHTGSDLDVLIIGGYFGSGRRGGQVAQFLLGIAEKPKAGEYPTKFYSFCKVGTGLTDQECEHLVQKLNPYFRRNEKNSRPPSCYSVTNNSKERPDVWVDPPDKSVIMEITSDIRTIHTDVFAAPYGLRFPRVNKVRYEKPWYDCLDVQSLVDMVNSTSGNTLNLQGYGKIEKKSKLTKRAKKADGPILPLVPSHMRVTDVSHVKRTSQIFQHLIFYIVNNSNELSRETLHKLVVENGGSFSMNLNNDVTHAIAAERKGIKFQASIPHGDVIHYSWVIDCCNSKELQPVRPKYYLHLSNQTREKMKADVDDFGDYYFVDIDVGDLKQLFENIDPLKLATDCDELSHYKAKYCPTSTFSRFANLKFYFHKPIHSSNPDSQTVAEITLKRQELEILMHAGTVCPTLSNDVTHMIIYKASEHLPFRTIVKSISTRDRRLLRSLKLNILSHQWIDAHAWNTHGHPSEAEYDLRDPSFRFNDQEIETSTSIHSHSDQQDVEPSPDRMLEEGGGGENCRARVADAGEVPSTFLVAEGNVGPRQKRSRGSDDQKTEVISEDAKASKTEHGASSAEVHDVPRSRLVTLEKPSKRRRHVKDSINVKKEDVAVRPIRSKHVTTVCLPDIPQDDIALDRSVGLEETSKHGKRPSRNSFVKTQEGAVKLTKGTNEPNNLESRIVEPAFDDRSAEIEPDRSTSHRAEGSSDLSNRENFARHEPRAPIADVKVENTFDVLMGELFPRLDQSQQCPLEEDKSREAEPCPMIEKIASTPTFAGSTSSFRSEIYKPDSEIPSAEAVNKTIDPASNVSVKKKVSYKNLVGNLLKPK